MIFFTSTMVSSTHEIWLPWNSHQSKKNTLLLIGWYMHIWGTNENTPNPLESEKAVRLIVINLLKSSVVKLGMKGDVWYVVEIKTQKHNKPRTNKNIFLLQFQFFCGVFIMLIEKNYRITKAKLENHTLCLQQNTMLASYINFLFFSRNNIFVRWTIWRRCNP